MADSVNEALVEEVAYGVILGSAGKRAADHAREFKTANWEDGLRSARAIIPIVQKAAGQPDGARFTIGDLVQKKRNSQWRGKVVGFYQTEATPIGYAVESAFEVGSVQVWPEAALLPWDGDHRK